MDEIKREDFGQAHKKKKLEYMRENPWIVSTLILTFLVVIMLIGNFSGITGKSVSEKDAGELILSVANSQGANAELVDIVKEGSFYKVTLSIQDSEVPVYVTKDGKYYIPANYLIPLTSEEEPDSTDTTEDIPKSDRPVVELFIWGYCPYGVQAQGPLAEVADLLGEYADFKAVMYYDGHGEFETQENKIQECIQEVAPDKYWDYASGFVKNIYPVCSSSKTVDCDKTESVKLMKSLGIDSNKVLSCVESKGEDLVSEAFNYAKENDVTGSPTLIINGVKVSAPRNAEAFKGAVCEAFNNAPEECATVLSSDASASQGNC